MAFVGGLIGASIGSAIAMLVFAPLTAVNNFLGSYYFGSGMILGEREMYQERWPQIKKELDKGRSFIDVLEEVMKESTQGVMNSAERTLTDIKPEWERIVKNYMATIPQNIVAALRTDISLEDIIALWQGGTAAAEPAPPDETIPFEETLITKTIAEIQSWSLNTLLFEAQPSQITKYTEATQAHILTEKASRASDQDITDTGTQETTDLLFDLAQEERAFLRELSSFSTGTIENLYANFITKHSSIQQTEMINWLKAFNVNGVFTKRRRTDGSDDQLVQIGKQLSEWKLRWQADPSVRNTMVVNSINVLIVVWQMIYSI